MREHFTNLFVRLRVRRKNVMRRTKQSVMGRLARLETRRIIIEL